jgi:hypothetical protein
MKGLAPLLLSASRLAAVDASIEVVNRGRMLSRELSRRPIVYQICDFGPHRTASRMYAETRDTTGYPGLTSGNR